MEAGGAFAGCVRLEGEARLEVKAMAGRKVDATVLSIPARFPLSKYFRHKQVAGASASCRNWQVAAATATENVSLETFKRDIPAATEAKSQNLSALEKHLRKKNVRKFGNNFSIFFCFQERLGNPNVTSM